jgi:DNA-binding HxlR family transcriptional regulator
VDDAPPLIERCPMEITLRVISGKWKGVILFYLMERPMRFGELRRAVNGITQRILSQQLRELERHGIVSRTELDTPLAHVEYAMTEFGCSLAPVLAAMCDWGEKNAGKVLAAEGVARRP